MGKHGPCYHCGVTSTPLWRNGPPEKPVLCNACGSRWRTKGTLANYTPLHARPEHDESDTRHPMFRAASSRSKELKVLKRKLTNDVGEIGIPHLETRHGVHEGFDEDTSNRSSSGSAISNNESCAQYGSADASELTGPSQASSAWDSTVPSRKRSCFLRTRQSPVEKLTKDLYTIWHQQQASCLSGSSEEDLLLESDKPMVSVEIGHGSVLIRHPNSVTREEESEASSHSFESKLLSSGRMASFSDYVEDSVANRSFMGARQFNKSANQGAFLRSGRGADQMDNFQILASHGSPLRLVDLQDILNYEEFSDKLTNDEQQKLLKLLPTVDSVGTSDSLKMMFSSVQFRDNILSFQKLLGEGVFDGSASGISTEDCKNLKKHILSDQRKSSWVEQYTRLKDSKGKNNMEIEMLEGCNGFATARPMSMSKPRDGQHKKLPGPNAMLKTPATEGVKLSNKDSSLSRANGIFPFQNEDLCSISDVNIESYEEDLLIDVPSNNIYPESELLIPITGKESSSSSSVFQVHFLHPR